MKKKVLHIISSLNDGGAEGVLYKVASYKSCNIVHVVVSMTGSGKYSQLLLNKGIKVKNLNMDGIVKSLLSFFVLWRYILKEKPFVVQTWMYHADVIGGCAARLAGGGNIVWNIRSGEIHATQKITIKFFIKLSAILSGLIPRSIVSCSNRAIKIHKKIGYKGNFYLINNGVDLDVFNYASSKRKKIREELLVSNSCVLFGMVARFDPQKDHYNLLQAIKHTDGNYMVALIGFNVDLHNKKLLNWIDRLKISHKVILLGQRSDVSDVMCALDYSVLSSLYGEAFPNVLVESMSVGKPCISTDVGDSARIIGKYGWIVKSKSPDGLSSAMMSAIKLKTDDEYGYNNLSSNCAEYVEKEFSLEAMISEYKKVWRVW